MTEIIMRPEGQAAVRDYVARVRGALSDLPPQDVDDLAGGLEADLAERAAELPAGTDLALAFGAPQAYAAELRSAAGLPDPAPASAPARASFLETLDAFLHSVFTGAMAKWPWLNDLRPVWWLLRGFVLGWVLVDAIGTATTAPALLGGLAGALLSFLWGRSARPPSRWVHRLVLVANVVALMALSPVATDLLASRVVYVETLAPGPDTSLSPYGPDGVWVNGEPASNLYAYDAQGNRIDNVRLFNQFGQAVSAPMAPWLEAPPEKAPPMNSDGGFDANFAVFPVRWGELTGWEASLGGWEPPVKISDLSSHQGSSPQAAPTAPAARTAPEAAGSAQSPSAAASIVSPTASALP